MSNNKTYILGLFITQKVMAELFQTTPQNITLHLKNLYVEDELKESKPKITLSLLLAIKVSYGNNCDKKINQRLL